MSTLILQNSPDTRSSSSTVNLSCHTSVCSDQPNSDAFLNQLSSASQTMDLLNGEMDRMHKRSTNVANTRWASKYVPNDFLVQGKTLREQISLLLQRGEIQTFRNALNEFMSTRNIDSLLFQLQPILSGDDKRREVLWQYVFFCLTGRERERLRKRMFDLTEMKLPDFSTNENGSALLQENISKNKSSQKHNSEPQSSITESNKDTSSQDVDIGSENIYSTPSCNRIFPASSVNAPSKSVSKQFHENQLESTRRVNNSTSVRRQRRRRTVGNIQFSSTEYLQNTDGQVAKLEESQQSSSENIMAVDSAFFDNEQQAQRRRKRAYSRRRRSCGIFPSEEAGRTRRSSSNFTPEGLPNLLVDNHIQDSSKTSGVQSPRRERRRSSQREVVNSTSTPRDLKASVKQEGDKKRKVRSSTSEPPSSRAEDVAVKDQVAQRCQDKDPAPGSESNQSTKILRQEQNDVRESDSRKSKTSGDGREGKLLNSGEDKLIQSNLPLNPCRSPNFDAIFLENTKQKGGYLNALKKRFTFSRPPKSSDTDTFLCELSAQFDQEMNLIDDIEIVEEEKPDFKFGEKWSYLPPSNNNDNSNEPLSQLNGSSVPHEKFEVKHNQDKSDNASMANSVAAPNCDEKSIPLSNDTVIHSSSSAPPFPVNLDDVEPTYPPSPPDTIAPNATENQSRNNRLRRRRRRNTEKRNEEGITGGESLPEEGSVRRTSDPFPSYQQTENGTRISQNDDVIYDVPKPVVAPQRRAHVNVEKRGRRSRANRNALLKKRNSTELQMHVWSGSNSPLGEVKLRSPSPVDQGSFFERARKKNYRVSGVSVAMEDVFSKAEEDLNKQSFYPAPETSPPTPSELLDEKKMQESDFTDPDEVYAPLRDEVLALGLAYNENEQQEPEDYQAPQTSSTDTNTVIDPSAIPPPPPVPPPFVPPPPPVPLSPPLGFKNTPPNSPVRASVKRINWEKIEPINLGDTVWGQLSEDHDTINDVVKYLALEEHFAMKNSKAFKAKSTEVKKDTISLMTHKKAYNISILLAHLKLSHRQICDCLCVTGSESIRKRMDASHFKQLLLYAPDQEEVKKLKEFKGDSTKLNEADLLAIKIVSIPGYALRLRALVFKHSFVEKEEEIQKNLEVIQRAALQLRKSKKLAKILEFVLAMGNYMNRGHTRISKATGFRIHFLADIDSTKTSDNKLTFLHILARAVISKFPDVISFADEIRDVRAAARVTYRAVLEDLQDFRKVWLHVRDNLSETSPKDKRDKFKIAMETCLVRTNGSIKGLEQLHNATVKEFNKVAKYFGENPKNISMQQFFKIFDEFTRKFEKSQHEIRKFVKHKATSVRAK